MIRTLVMIAVTFFCLSGVAANHWHFPDVCIGLAIWFTVLAASFIVEMMTTPEPPVDHGPPPTVPPRKPT